MQHDHPYHPERLNFGSAEACALKPGTATRCGPAGFMGDDFLTKAAERRQRQLYSIPAAWRLPAGAAPGRDVRAWLEHESGLLDKRELLLTGLDDAVLVLDKLHSREWSASELCKAYCKRAALAGQLVRLSLFATSLPSF